MIDVSRVTDWTRTATDEAALRAEFCGNPSAHYRPLAAWWWSGERLDEQRLLWQLDRIAELGFGGVDVTGLAMHGPSAGSVADDPPALSPEYVRLLELVLARCRDLGLGFSGWNPHQMGQAVDPARVLAADAAHRGELVRVHEGQVDVQPYGLDYGSRAAMAAHEAPGTITRRYSDVLDPWWGDPVVAFFEDEWPAFARWSPEMPAALAARGHDDVPLEVFEQDCGPRTPAWRVALFDTMVDRVVESYTARHEELIAQHGLLAGFDQNNRMGSPLISTAYYLDPFRTMAWANAPGTDQMGDARFHLSMADLTGAPRVWLEGFHSHGYGMSLSDQMRLLWTWAREGVSLYLPHGVYYATRGFWWEWAPPEIGWRQPYARHTSAFSAAVGRLMAFASAGRHVPEVAVLYPTTTVWAGTTGHLSWDADALAAEHAYVALMGVQAVPSGIDLERARRPSLLAQAHYDRVVVDEPNVDAHGDLPIVLPSCRVLRTETLTALVEGAERGRCVVVVAPLPEWSAEHGRDDPVFRQLAERLARSAHVVERPEDVVAHLPSPRAGGLPSQWRRAGGLDLLLVTGEGELRLRDCADRRPQRWDERTGAVTDLAARVDGGDLVVDVPGPAALLSLPVGTPVPHLPMPYDEVELPTIWDCDYPECGENRWGDLRLPPNEGPPPVERRTFAWREGDEPDWRMAPVVPEDVAQPTEELGFEDRMTGRTGRLRPEDRVLPDGWHEVVSTFGPRAVTDDGRLLAWSERYGIEDLALSTPLGLKGRVEPYRVDLGESDGTVTSWVHLHDDAETHLVVEGSGVLTVQLAGEHLVGPVECGVLEVPVRLTRGWHRLTVEARRRAPQRGDVTGLGPGARTRLGWVLGAPYSRPATGIWGGPVVHPDYKGSPGPLRLRRRVVVDRPARLEVELTAAGTVTTDAPEVLPPGEHVVEVEVGRALAGHHLTGTLRLSTDRAVTTLTTDDRWEARGEDGTWTGAFEVASGGAVAGGSGASHEPPRRHVLSDVGWLEGEQVLQGQLPQLWSDSPDVPPPSWFCFLAAPGARSLTLPVDGDVEAWVDGAPVPVVEGRLALTGGARVSLRVQAGPGRRGAACFTEHPVYELGPGQVATGLSWHRQGLDVFAGVVLHRTTVDLPRACRAELDLGDVRGSVSIRVDGEEQGVLFCPPWRLPLDLPAGPAVLELEVAGTLGPLVARGIPTQFGPEDQRTCGVLGSPVLRIPREDEA